MSAGMTTAQIAALYALRNAAPVLEVEPVMRGWWLITVGAQRWLIDEAGRTTRYSPNEEAA